MDTPLQPPTAAFMRYGIIISVLSLIGLLSHCTSAPDTPSISSIQAELNSEITLNPSQILGKKIFFDSTLSNPIGQSCATCHMPKNGFADPEQLAVSRGANKSMFGTRNAPTVTYAAFTPFFHYNEADEVYVGGLFWDGRSATLHEQATNPFLTHHEMGNTDKKMVVERIKNAEYKDLFLYVFGPDAFDSVDLAFDNIALAIEEFEETAEVNPFTSKFDYYQKGLVQLTDQEMRGLEIFNDTVKAKCAACHPTTPDPHTNAVLFTDYTYDNIGLPINPHLIELNKDYKPDLGLGAILKKPSENGKFKVPTLRNVAITAPYFHNGVFKTLEEVMDFYNARDSGKFGPPEVKENVNTEELGDLKLTEQEMSDVVAFMKTLTDGYNIQVIKKQ